MTQRERILQMLQEAGPRGVFSFDFYAEYMPRFAARIEEMRKDGIRISSEHEGSGVRYRLDGEVVGDTGSSVSGPRESGNAATVTPDASPEAPDMGDALFDLPSEGPISAITGKRAA